MSELPRGTVTFLFTDIEGSTRLLAELGAEAYGDLLAEHRRVLREAFARNGGVEVDTQGDAFFAAFPTAPQALAAAREGQAALQLPVRMGLHTGTPRLADEGYIGVDVHRAARIAAAGHGGQVLVSAATAALVDAADLRDLGEHRLKDLSAPERIYQVGERDFAPLKTLYRTNLPIPATAFLGREQELASVRALLGRDDARLLTLTGAGGSGKTRLALQAAGEAAGAYPDGVWWVPLAPLSDAADVGLAAARALGGGASLPELVDGRRLLLLLDNFEHVIEAAPEVAAVLAECPHADVLVTSRERLRVHGEHVYPVPVLEPGEARRLFVTRARAAQPDFEPDEHLDDLCARLDNLPLALELAAARTSLLTTGQLLDRLRGRLDLLQGGRDAETRQRTLRATIEWSYDLLDINERDLLAALSIFRGGWTLEAAEYVADADLELMQSLVDKSLVRHWVSGRFGMLETIREFAAERLEPQRHDVLRGRSLDYLLSLFEGANLRHRSRGQPQMELAQEERANVEAALRWAEESDPVKGLQLLDLQEMFWFTNDPSRAREHLDKLLAAAGAGLDPRVRMDALRLRGSTFYFSTGRHDLAEADYLSAIELARSIGDDDQAWHLSLRVAHCALEQGDVQRVKQLVAERLAHGGGYEGDQAVALGLLAKAAFGAGDVAEGARLAHDAARAAQAAGRTWWRAVTLMDTAEILALSGELDVAAADHAEGLRALWSVQDLVSVPRALMIGAVIAARRAQATRAGRLWGAAESDAARQPRPTTMQALAEYETHLAPVRGKDFDEARQYGRGLSLSAAVGYALGEVK